MARAAAITFGALLLSACGADSPEDLQIAVQSAADTLAYPEGDEASCIGDSIFSAVGYEQLVADGHSIASIQLDPEASIATLLDAHGSDELSASIVDCLDANGRFRTQLSEQHLSDGISCETEFGTDTALVRSHIESIVAGDDPSIDIEDTDELRDLLRPCASDQDFATAFDLKTAEELAAAIDTELGTNVRLDEQPCVGPLVVELIGYEALNEQPLGVDGKQMDFDALEIDDDERAKLIADIAACSDFIDRLRDDYRTSEPYFGPCVIEAIADHEDWLHPSVEFALGIRTSDRAMKRTESFALDDCVEDQIEASFGTIDSSIQLTAFDFASGIFEGTAPVLLDYGPTEAEYQCMTYGLFHELGAEEVFSTSATVLEEAEETIAYWEAIDRLWGTLGRARQTCVGDWMTVAGDVTRAGFSDETLDCLRGELEEFGEVKTYADLLNADTATLTDAAYWEHIDLLDDWYLAFTGGLEDCYVDGEKGMFDDYMAWLSSTESDTDLLAA